METVEWDWMEDMERAEADRKAPDNLKRLVDEGRLGIEYAWAICNIFASAEEFETAMEEREAFFRGEREDYDQRADDAALAFFNLDKAKQAAAEAELAASSSES